MAEKRKTKDERRTTSAAAPPVMRAGEFAEVAWRRGMAAVCPHCRSTDCRVYHTAHPIRYVRCRACNRNFKVVDRTAEAQLAAQQKIDRLRECEREVEHLAKVMAAALAEENIRREAAMHARERHATAVANLASARAAVESNGGAK